MKIKIGWLIFVALFLYFIFLIRTDVIKFMDLKKQEVNFKNSIQEQRERWIELKLRQDQLKSKEGIELLARQRLGMIKKDETLYKIIKP